MNSFIGTKEAAERLHISVRRVQALIAAGRLPARKIGNSFAIKEVDLKKLNGRKNGRPHPENRRSKSRERWKELIDRFAGSVDGLPPDLSANIKKYMEGFGK